MKKELKLQAWIDGELTAAEARRVAPIAARDAEAGQIAAELRGVKAAMSGAEIARRVPETREFYWSKIERQIQREGCPSPARSFEWSWRRLWAPLAGLAALGCVALVAFNIGRTDTDTDTTGLTDDSMEAVTFHDQAAGLTVIWLQARVAAPAHAQTTTD